MATPLIKTHNDDVIDVKRQSLYARLRRLFSTDVIVRNVGGKQLKIKDTDNVMYASDKNSMRDRFNRIRSTSYNAYTRDFALSYQAARMDLFRDYDCVGPDTIIPLPDGTFPTIAELTEKYKDKPQERFYVFSYDHKTDSIKLGKAYHPRKKDGGMRKCWKVIFDNDEFIIGSAGHPFLMRNGEYKKLENLSVGDSIMPFYKKDFFGKGYIHLYNFSKGWQTAHKIIAEQFYRPLLKNKVVHHKNHCPSVNIPANLQIMTKEEHSLFHSIGKNNPFYGRKYTKESNEKRSKTLKEVFNNRNQSGEKNPKYRDDLSIEVLKLKAIEYYKSNGKLTSLGFIKDLKCDYSVLQNRLQLSNTDWNTFKNEIVSTLNHKIKAIEYVGEMEVYDVTVEEYQNFATSNCFVHNTMDSDPILASALDIYSDECLTYNEMGNILTVHSTNNNVKEILENLFNDILNIQHNLWSWTRNMPVKYNSPIPLLSGEVITIEELSKKIKNKDEVWVYSVQDKTNAIVPGKVVWCDKTYTTTKIAKITLDDGSILESAPEHPFILRNGDVKRADELLENDSLMPFYRKLSAEKGGMNKYEMVYNPNNNEYNFTHRLVAKSCNIEKNKVNRILHHVDFNKYNNSHPVFGFVSYNNSDLHNTRKFTRIPKANMSPFVISNHKVKHVEICNDICDVYCMTVVGPNGEDDRHNFAVCGRDFNGNITPNSGVFVKNCKYGDFFLKLYITPEYGIYMVDPISAYNVERIENTDPYNKRYVKFQIRPTDTAQAEVCENYEMAHFRLMSDSNFLPYGKCIKGNSVINTEFGAKQIQDLKIGENIWHFNEKNNKIELTDIKSVWCTGEKEILKIRTQHNFIECSYDHRILTYNTINNSFEYKCANDLKIGDLLVINSNKNKKSKNEIKINKIIVDNKDVTCPIFTPEVDNVPDIIDNEFAEFFGFMIGDGWAKEYTNGNTSNYRVCFSLGLDEEQNKRYISILEKYAGKKCNMTKHGGNSRTVTIYSKRLYFIFKNMGFGESAKTKRIPQWVFESSSEIQMAFIFGFGNADGWTFNDKYDITHYAVEICNQDLLLDFKSLLQLNNIKTSIPKGNIYNDTIDICNITCNRTESWLLYYYLDSNLKSQQTKYNFIETDEFILDPIRKIEDGGVGKCWDLEVNSEYHNFIANGIVVHNCLAYNTIISTINGPKEIKDIQREDIVYSFDFDNKKTICGKVLNTIMSGIKTTYEIKTAHRKIYATAEHPVMVQNGTYKQVKDLTIDDYLILPSINNFEVINYPSLVVNESINWKYDSKLKKIDENIIKDKFSNFVRFFGFLLGDGWLDKSNQTIGFSIGSRIDKSKKYIDFINDLGINYRLTNELNSDSSCIINSVYLYKLVEQWGFKTGSINKIVPSWIWTCSNSIKQELLFGFSDADGCDIDENAYQLGSINKELISHLRMIAIECGFSTTKIWDTIGSGYNDSCQMFLFTYRLKSRDFIEFSNGHHIEKIRGITESNKVEVYDIQIDNNLHNFIAEGVVVHNSVVEGARRVWKQLSLMEDAMLIHRIMRAPEKRIFYTDVGNLSPDEVELHMKKQKDLMKKVPYMDEMTGDYNLRFNLMNMVEDYFIAVRGGDSGTKIDTLGGMDWTGTEDIEYLRNKMMAALKIPKAFLGYEESVGGKATLACVVPETKIPLLNGVTKTVKELIDDYNNGIKNYVYSIDENTKNIVPGEIEWAGFTRMNTDVIRVHLDNKEYIDCTPDHKFMTRNGNWVEAQTLVEGQSLMPLYCRKTKLGKLNDYEQVYNISDEKWKYTHKIVDNYTNRVLIQTAKFADDGYVCVHHKDYNRFNNNPENLQRMTWKEHGKLHEENYSYLKKWIEKNGHYSKTFEGRTFISERNKTLKSHKNLKNGYDKKYKSGKYDTTGNLNGKWRDRPEFDCVLDKINTYSGSKDNINTLVSLCKYLKYHTSIIREVIEKNGYSVNEFLNQYIGFRKGRPNHIKKNFFLNEIGKYKNPYQYIKSNGISYKGYRSILKYIDDKSVINHKVTKIEILSEKRDTCDITVKYYHNFATSAGVIIHNSEDVRFARTIQRVQRILTSELTKIAIVHLYSQGYRDESLVEFELELTNPSTIFEREKLEIWNDKVDVAVNMMEAKLFSKDWIYKNIFNMSEDDAKSIKSEVVDDVKQNYRFASIEEEGNDPAQPFKKIGSGKVNGGGGGGGGGGGLGGGLGGMGGGPEDENPEGGPEDENPEGGPEDENPEGSPEDENPEEPPVVKEVKLERDQSGEHKASDHPFGEDPLGSLELMSKPKENSEGKKKSDIRHNFEGGSPLAMREQKFKPKVDKTLMNSLSKFNSATSNDIKQELLAEIRMEGNKKSLLDESNIL